MFIAAQLINGISASALLLIYSLGVVVIMGHMNVVNMAHGECIMLGAYVCYYINTVAGAPFFVALIMSFVVTALFGLLIERLVIRKLYGKTAETLLATYALSLIVKQLINLFCGSELKYIAIPFDGHFDIGGVTIPYYNIFIILFGYPADNMADILQDSVRNKNARCHQQPPDDRMPRNKYPCGGFPHIRFRRRTCRSCRRSACPYPWRISVHGCFLHHRLFHQCLRRRTSVYDRHNSFFAAYRRIYFYPRRILERG